MNRPRVLVIDDFFGRTVPGDYQQDRTALCEKFGLIDVSEGGVADSSLVMNPVADAVFLRGQKPNPATVGDIITNDLNGCVEAVRRGVMDTQGYCHSWSMVLLDLCFYTGVVTASSNRRAPGMPEGSPSDDDPQNYFGLQILRSLQQHEPEIPVVILSSKARQEVSREFARLGAVGFLPRDAEDSPPLLAEYIERHALVPDHSGRIIGTSKELLVALRAARRIAGSHGNVLLRGEAGTGKELFARYIHDHSPRKNTGYESRSLAAIPQALAESELFGHAKGAFTGAKTDRPGAFESAEGGTLFLDEIGDAAADLQAKLLRVLETGEIQRLGQDKTRKVDVRVVSATNVNIEDRAAKNEGFREDLLARLRQGGTIHLPPLRERKEDIPLLAEHFTRLAEKAHGRAMHRELLPETITFLQAQEWPGNIRDLRNCIWQAVMEYPDVEFMAPTHVKGAAAPVSATKPRAVETKTAPTSTEAHTLANLMRMLEQFEANRGNASDWAGKLDELQIAWAHTVASLVSAALQVTKRVSVDAPQGEVLIHPAMKLLTGKSDLSASKAADLIKRLLTAVPTGSPVPCPATIKTDPRRQLELTPDRVVLRGGRGALRHAV
jgi:DNA-binding NtrC family response regulator